MTTDGTPTEISLLMVSRFNGANENGTAANRSYPASATRDSLYGNTELFGTLENVTPIFKLSGLAAGTTCNLTFYASRMDAPDNRETRYTVTGSTSAFADLNAANNVEDAAIVSGIQPNAEGEISVTLMPGAKNTNPYHFTYLGVLQLDWTIMPASAAPPVLSTPSFANGAFRFQLAGTTGKSYRLQGSRDLRSWTDLQSITLTENARTVEIAPPDGEYFYRVVTP